MQTRLQSLIETLVNIGVGFFVALASQILIFPLFGIHTSLATDIQITTYFTAISILRSYLLRRFFNYWHTERLKRAGLQFSAGTD